jgi:hypothetical protein
MKCIGCHKKPAKWQEKGNPDRVFCGKPCQIGLKDPELSIDDDDIVGFETSDGRKFTLKEQEAKQMLTIANLLEEGAAVYNDYIPLPNIDGATFELLIKFIHGEELSFLEMQYHVFFDLFDAANYLDFQNFIAKVIGDFGWHLYMVLTHLDNMEDFVKYFGNGFVVKKEDIFNPFIARFRSYVGTSLFFTYRDIRTKIWQTWRKLKLPGLEQLERIFGALTVDTHGIYSGFVAAASSGQTEAIRLFLANPSINPSFDENLALRLAAQRNRVEVGRLLIADPRVNPACFDNLPIKQAAYNGHVDFVQLLLTCNAVLAADPNIVETLLAHTSNADTIAFLQKRRKHN